MCCKYKYNYKILHANWYLTLIELHRILKQIVKQRDFRHLTTTGVKTDAVVTVKN